LAFDPLQSLAVWHLFLEMEFAVLGHRFRRGKPTCVEREDD
jgi:hypothetical protein